MRVGLVTSVSVALAALTLVAGCTAAPTPAPSPSSSSPARSPTPTPTLVVAARAGDLPLAEGLEQWSTFAGPSPELQSVFAFEPDRLAVVLVSGSGQTVALLSPEGRKVHPVPSGQIVQNVYLVGDDVVFDSAAPVADDFWITRWDPATGDTKVVYSATGAHAEFSETALDGTLLFMTGHDEGRACVRRMDLTQDEPAASIATVSCAPAGTNIGWLKVTDHVVSYMSGTAALECPALHRLLPDGEDSVVEVDGCASRGIADEQWAVWTEPPPVDAGGGTNFSIADLRVQVGGKRYDLGTATAGSTTVCGDALYWTWHDPESPPGPEQIRRWRPGGKVEVVYRSPDRGSMYAYATGAVICSGDQVGFQRIGWWGSAGQEFMVNANLGWTPDLAPGDPSPAGP